MTTANKSTMNVPDELYKRPEKADTTPKRGATYTMYKLLQLVEKIGQQRDNMTHDQLLELVKLAGNKKMVVVTTKAGTVFTHVQPVNNNVKPTYKGAKSRKVFPITRFTGWNGTGFGTFHVSNVKSFRIADTHEIVRPEPVNAADDDTYFAY